MGILRWGTRTMMSVVSQNVSLRACELSACALLTSQDKDDERKNRSPIRDLTRVEILLHLDEVFVFSLCTQVAANNKL